MFNRLALYISYDDLERVDIVITQKIINLAGPNRVTVPKLSTHHQLFMAPWIILIMKKMHYQGLVETMALF